MPADIRPFEFVGLPKYAQNMKCASCGRQDSKYGIKLSGTQLIASYRVYCAFCFYLMYASAKDKRHGLKAVKKNLAILPNFLS